VRKHPKISRPRPDLAGLGYLGVDELPQSVVDRINRNSESLAEAIEELRNLRVTGSPECVVTEVAQRVAAFLLSQVFVGDKTGCRLCCYGNPKRDENGRPL
jgi:hypothetical protein